MSFEMDGTVIRSPAFGGIDGILARGAETTLYYHVESQVPRKVFHSVSTAILRFSLFYGPPEGKFIRVWTMKLKMTNFGLDADWNGAYTMETPVDQQDQPIQPPH
jgi:hypothetical protein